MRHRLAILSSGLIFATRLYNPSLARSSNNNSFQRRRFLHHLRRPTFGIPSTFASPSTFCCAAIMPISYSLLKQQSAETSNALMEHWKSSEDFLELSKYEGQMTAARDQEDGEKLQVGIDLAKNKGVIDPNFRPDPYVEIDVLGKTPNQVADIILDTVQKNHHSNGSVICLVGLSGTGKGTTVAALRQKLTSQGKQVVTWSNGNIFRSVTLLAATWCEQNNCADNIENALTKENLASFMDMLTFDKFDGKYDTRIHGLGLDMMVSQVQNTELKQPKVSKNIPTVAEVTQGEVIHFAAKAVERMGRDGLVVLLEGREETVNYVPTPYRFALVLSDASLIGKRRAAQRIMANALASLPDNATDAQVNEALQQSLTKVVSEMH